MKKAIRDRSIFTVIACITLAVCMLAPSVIVEPVDLAPEMQEVLGEERTEAFSRCLEGFQVWYHDKTMTTEGVVVSQADYDQLEAILTDCITYLNREEVALDSLSAELQEAYEWADMNLAYFMVSVVMPFLEILTQQESYTCEQSVWVSIDTMMDQLIGIYQSVA